MLGAGPLQTPAIRCLKDLGCQVACLDWDPKAVGFPLSDRPEVISTLDAKRYINSVGSKRGAIKELVITNFDN